ncbi:MAG: hypothetical protein R2762_17995 [Bryobacteraceae bacterium]
MDAVPSLFVTWRLHGTLPLRRSPPRALADGRQFVSIDRLLDREVAGPTWLRRPEIAEIVAGTLQAHAAVLGEFDLHAWVVMPNHVHALLTPRTASRPAVLRWREAAGRLALQALGLAGRPFWHHDTLERIVSDRPQRIARYIESVPCTRLARSPEEFPWSSRGAALQPEVSYCT